MDENDEKEGNRISFVFDVVRCILKKYICWTMARKRSRWIHKAGGDGMTNVELLCVLIAVSSLALTIYFGKR